VQWRQTLANRTLALHLLGGRQLFVTTGGALWTQQRSSGVCYKQEKEEEEEEERTTSRTACKFLS